MLEKLRHLQHLSIRLKWAGTVESLPRHECPVLIFFHGYSLAHTIRALRGRGYPVEFAGVGPPPKIPAGSVGCARSILNHSPKSIPTRQKRTIEWGGAC